MLTDGQIRRAARAVKNSFDKGIPFLKFGDGDDALVLCYRRKGETIESDECESDLLVHQTAVFKRCLKFSGDRKGFTFLPISHLTEDDLADALPRHLENLDFATVETLPMDAAYQTMQHEENQERSARRTARLGR